MGDTTVRPAPTGDVYLGSIFNSGAIFIVDRGHEIYPSTAWTFSGQSRNHDVGVSYRGHVGHLRAEFTTTGLYRLTGIPGEQVTNTSADALAFSPVLAKTLSSVALEPLCREERLRTVERCLGALIPDARDDEPLVAAAAPMLEDSNGCARIDDICGTLGVSERSLCRRFQRIVGVTPKYFGLVRKINYAVEMLSSDNVAALTALALQGGFYDQCHFSRAMRSFFGQGSQRLLRSKQPELSTFLGKSRQASSWSPRSANRQR